MPPRTPRRSSPGTPRLVERCVPVATSTASKPSACSASRSRTGLFVTISTPIARTLSMSRSTTASRQAVGRDREPQEAAGLRRRLEDPDAVAVARQLPGGGQAGRARSPRSRPACRWAARPSMPGPSPPASWCQSATNRFRRRIGSVPSRTRACTRPRTARSRRARACPRAASPRAPGGTPSRTRRSG